MSNVSTKTRGVILVKIVSRLSDGDKLVFDAITIVKTRRMR